MNKHEVLAVKKDGYGYHWFSLFTREGFEFTVYGVDWIVDETIETPLLIITERSKDPERIEKCKITCNSEHMSNLLSALGWSTPEKPSDMIFVNSFEETISNFKSAIWEFERILKETHE